MSALLVATVAVTTAHLIVAGLLPSIAADFGVDIPTAGLLITGYSIGLAILSPILALTTGDVPRKRLMVVVMAGTSRLDNRKFKNHFAAKPRMLSPEEVFAITSHPIGGVCPFGLFAPLPVYCDESLLKYQEVVPAAGAINAAVRIGPEHMAKLTNATWVDVGQLHVTD